MTKDDPQSTPALTRFSTFVLRALLACVLLAVAGGISLRLYNYFVLQSAMNKVMAEAGSENLRVSVHFERYYRTDALVFDIRSLGRNAPVQNLLRSFYDLSSRLQDRAFEKVTVSARGRPVMIVDGATFKDLGAQYGQTDVPTLNHNLALAVQLPGGRRLVEVDKHAVARLLMAASGRARGR